MTKHLWTCLQNLSPHKFCRIIPYCNVNIKKCTAFPKHMHKTYPEDSAVWVLALNAVGALPESVLAFGLSCRILSSPVLQTTYACSVNVTINTERHNDEWTDNQTIWPSKLHEWHQFITRDTACHKLFEQCPYKGECTAEACLNQWQQVLFSLTVHHQELHSAKRGHRVATVAVSDVQSIRHTGHPLLCKQSGQCTHTHIMCYYASVTKHCSFVLVKRQRCSVAGWGLTV